MRDWGQGKIERIVGKKIVRKGWTDAEVLQNQGQDCTDAYDTDTPMGRIAKCTNSVGGYAVARCDVLYPSLPKKGHPIRMKVTVHQLQEQLPALLEHTVQSGEECIVQRQGKDYAVLVSVRAWRQRVLGRRLDALGPKYRLAPEQQARIEALLAKRQERGLTSAERRELTGLLRACDDIMLRRAKALDSLR